ncbi:unnamed protein product [Adineta ricciae]|uniref:Uncharacterized protein n=1 Tax=Adineta ricciae TaxID=249248 RepID=A0A815GFP9_ADIRI|nr:unnamed protein product [Adineta ricciae]
MVRYLMLLAVLIFFAEVTTEDQNERSYVAKCTAKQCVTLKWIAYSLWIVVLAVCIIDTLSVCVLLRYRHAFRRTNESSNRSEQELAVPLAEENIFQSGRWVSRYHQDGSWYSPHFQQINFSVIQDSLEGHGEDDVGRFNIIGHISNAALKMSMIKRYPSEADGYEVKIDLEWNSRQNAFVGKWFVHTNTYQDSDRFELKKV